jgi:hypothetical protein
MQITHLGQRATPRIWVGLTLIYFVFLTYFLIRYYDALNQGMSPFLFGLIVAAVFITAYPLFLWKRDSRPYPFIGRLSFAKWFLVGIAFGIIAVCAALFSELIVSYYSQ